MDTINRSKTLRSLDTSRLAFVKNFMAEQGITQKDLAVLFGKSKCAVSHIFSIADDMRFSEIEQIFESRSCHLMLSVTRDPFEDVGKYTLAQSDYLSVDGELVKPRLYFIPIAMKRYGVNRERLAALIGVKSSTIRYWLVTANDTYLSNIMDVTRALKCHLKVKIVDDRQDAEENSLVKDPSAEETRMIVETDNVRLTRLTAD